MRVLAAVATFLVLVALPACAAPQSEPIEGPAADQVRASLDSGDASFDHSTWDGLLAEGTADGLVDYRYFQEHRTELDEYLSLLAGAELERLAPAELKALLINAYNAYAIHTILEHPSVSSIRAVDGAFDGIEHRLGGHDLTLDNIEHNLLRPFFRDPRIHSAVNCVSMDCPPLPPWAFTGEEIEEQLEGRTRIFLSDPGNVRVEDGHLLLTPYFDWYGEDYVGQGWEPRAATIPEFIADYTRPEVAEFIAAADGEPPVTFRSYDWSLNAAVPPASSGDREGASREREQTGWVSSLRRRVQGLGPAAPLAYGLLYIVAVVILVPGAPLTIGAGVAFGLLWGTVLVSISAVLGAGAAFLLGRHLLRDRVERWIAGREKLAAVDRAVEKQGWKVVGLTRLSPLFPFNLQNYFYGLTGVRFWPYLLVSWIAMLPGTLLYVYIGVAGAGVAEAATGPADWGRAALQVGGLAATLVVVILVAGVARRELEKAADEGDDRARRVADPEGPVGSGL